MAKKPDSFYFDNYVACADLAVQAAELLTKIFENFDPAQIHTRATYQDPAQFSDGLDTVFVSGQPAILHGALTGRKYGTVLTR